MAKVRDEFSGRTRRTLQERVANKCSNPGCRVQTSGPNTIKTKATRIGEAAHITAAANPFYSKEIKQSLKAWEHTHFI